MDKVGDIPLTIRNQQTIAINQHLLPHQSRRYAQQAPLVVCDVHSKCMSVAAAKKICALPEHYVQGGAAHSHKALQQ